VRWLKIHLQEAQDTIVEIREAQWMLEERYAIHSKEGEACEGIAHATLSSEQKKQD